MKRIPFIQPTDEQLKKINEIVNKIIINIKETHDFKNNILEVQANEMIKAIYGL